MDNKVLQLIKLIGEEVHIFETFLEHLNRQQDALVANDITALEAVTRDQEELGLRTQQLEQERRALVTAICGELKRGDSDITLSELRKLVSEPESMQIHAMQSTLLSLHDQIAKIKQRNDFLIRKSMEYITDTINHLGLAETPAKASYTVESVRTTPFVKTSLVDRRA